MTTNKTCDQSIAKVKVPAILAATVFDFDKKPFGSVLARGLYGGRGSGKSFSVAEIVAVLGYNRKMRILCTREFQASIKNSFHAELKNAIESIPFLRAGYDVGVDYIKGKNGTEFIFAGLRKNISSIKSLSQIDLCIIEEAEDVPEYSWIALEPTIRKEGSEIWAIWNPRTKNSPVDRRFIQDKDDDTIIVKCNYSDNRWFGNVLDKRRQRDQKNLDPYLYNHIWNGDYLEVSDAQILNNKWVVSDFTPHHSWSGPYFGADWGFSQDPTTLVKLWIHENVLYVEHEAYQVGCEIDDTPALFDTIDGAKQNTIRADSARPEIISYLNRRGYKVTPAKKGAGSVESALLTCARTTRSSYIAGARNTLMSAGITRTS